MQLSTNSLNQDLISVIIPTYNRSSLVGEAIQSALDQTHPDVEIIVVDDGSTDDTSAILANLPSIRALYQKNQGQGAARQSGLEHAKGAYIATLDSDDHWQANFLADSLKILRKAEVSFVFSDWTTQTPEGNRLSESTLASLDYLQSEPHQKIDEWKILSAESTRRVFTRHSPAPSSSFLVDKRFITKGWHEHLNVSDDWAFLLEIILNHQNITCAYSSTNLWTKQIDGSNICDEHSDPIQLAKNLVQDYEKLISLFNNKLDTEELEYLRKKLALRYGDLAHFQSITPKSRRAAINNAVKCLRSNPRISHCSLLTKCLIRSLFGIRS